MFFKVGGIFILTMFIYSVSAQTTFRISGRVVDKSNGQSLTGVEVYLYDLNNGTITDTSGNFFINKLNEGSYKVRFSYIGYTSTDLEIKVPSAEAENIFVEMEESVIRLGEIIVSSNPFLSEPKNISQTTLSLSSLDLMVRENRSAAEILNFQPGIAMRSNGISAGRPVIRGFSGNKVLVLEDGLRMGDLSNSSDDHGVSGDGSQPEKIEVLEGPSSLLYGSGAIGGVVNIVTDAIPSTVYKGINGELLTQGSTVNNEYLGNAHLNYGAGIFSFHGKFFIRKGNDYKIPGGEKIPDSYINSHGSHIGFSVHPSWGVGGLSFSDFNNKYGLPSAPDENESAFIDMQKQQYRFALNNNRFDFFLTSMNIKAGYMDYVHKEISLETGLIETEFGLKTASADISFAHKPLSKNNNGVIGLYTLVQRYDVSGGEALTPNSNYDSYAAYFLENFEFGNFTSSFGARYESNIVKIPEAVLSDSSFGVFKRNFNSLSASAGMIYNITGNLSVVINAANAFRAPVTEELSSFAVHRALSGFDIGSRELQIEKSLGLDAGLRFNDGNYDIEITGFYNNIDNHIYRKPAALFYNNDEDPLTGREIGFNTEGNGLRVFKYEQADAAVYGFQAKIKRDFLKGYSVQLNSDYVRAKNLTANENIAFIPPFRTSVEIRYVSSSFWYGFTWNLTAPQWETAPDESPTPGFGIAGLYGGVKIFTGHFAHIIDMKISNVLDQNYQDHLSVIKSFVYMPGRNITLGYRFVF